MAVTIGGIGIDPQGQSLVVTITPSAKVYTDVAGTTLAIFPATITTRTPYFMSAAQVFTVSTTRGGVEIANQTGGTLDIDVQQGVFEWISPRVDSPTEDAAINSTTGVDAAAVATIAQPLVDAHAGKTAGTTTPTPDAHGAVAGTSKICLITSPSGTAENIFVAMESSPPAGLLAADVWVVAADGTL